MCLTLIFVISICGCEKKEEIISSDKSQIKPAEKAEKCTSKNADSKNDPDENSTKTNEKADIKKIESEKNVENDEKDSNEINTDVLPPEIESPIVNGLRVNVFATKKTYKLGEPMNIFVVLRNKSDKIIKLKTRIDRLPYDKTWFCIFNYILSGAIDYSDTGYSDFGSPGTSINISPNAVYCFKIDIQTFINLNHLTGKFKLYVYLHREFVNNDELIKSNTIEFEVVE